MSWTDSLRWRQQDMQVVEQDVIKLCGIIDYVKAAEQKFVERCRHEWRQQRAGLITQCNLDRGRL